VADMVSRLSRLTRRCSLYLLHGSLILCKTEAGARSSLQRLVIERSRACVSVIGICPWAWKEQLEQLLERPSRPFPKGQGPAWPARILEAGEF
jgi:hypothetical protein